MPRERQSVEWHVLFRMPKSMSRVLWVDDSPATVMAAFSFGATTPILALAYGSRQAIATRRNLLACTSRIAKPLMGAALVGIGVFVLTGFDKVVEASLTRAMPDWLVTVTTRL